MSAAGGKGFEIASIGTNNNPRLTAKFEYLAGICGKLSIFANYNRILLGLDNLRRDHKLYDRIENRPKRCDRARTEQIVKKFPATGALGRLNVHKIGILYAKPEIRILKVHCENFQDPYIAVPSERDDTLVNQPKSNLNKKPNRITFGKIAVR